MKSKICLFGLVLITLFSCEKKKDFGEVKFGIMDFVSDKHDFGVINQGTKVTYKFKFENVGENDLIISKVQGTCGCTVPTYSKTPIKPGKEGEIQVTFDSRGKSGKVSKSVIINANTPNGIEKLEITADVVNAEKKKSHLN